MSTRQEAIQTYSKWNNIWYMMKEIKLAGWHYYGFLLFDILSQIAVPVILVFLPSRVVVLLQNQSNITAILLESSIWIVSILIIKFIKTYSHERIMLLASLLCDAHYWYKLQVHQLSCDVMELENAKQGELLDEIRNGLHDADGMGSYAGILGMYMYTELLVVNVVGFLIFSFFAGGLHPVLLVILIVTSSLNCYAKNHALRYEVTHMDDFWENTGRFWYLKEESRNMAKAKDIRMYQLYDIFREKLNQNTMEATYRYHDINIKHRTSDIIIRFSTLLQYGIAYGFMIYLMKQGSLSISSFVAYIGIVAGFSSWVSQIVLSYSRITSISTHISVYRNYIKDEEPQVTTSTAIPPITSVHEIRFEDICFGYDEHLIFDHFSLTLHKGEKLAIVGINGAGKTTLIKLLCGLYPLQGGRILLDGEDIATMDVEVYRRYLSILFQDFHILPFSIAENVACSWSEEYEQMDDNEFSTFIHRHFQMEPAGNAYDEQRVIDCLKQTKLYDDLKLEQGIHTPMTQILDSTGIELSGGQTQRLMLARALYKNAPILILDEPTSALDPIAESDLYEEYANLCEDKISIFISHRLSSTRFCDRILFLDHGKILEEGNHESLMRQNGHYANMYQIQSHYYQEEVERNEAGI